MADRFDFNSVYEDESWTVLFKDARSKQEQFYTLVREAFEQSKFPNLEITMGDYMTGGLFFNKETTSMLKLKATQSNFEKFEIYYRAQTFCNVVIFTRMECMERDFFSILAGKTGSELKYALRQKCKNMAQYEEFIAIDSLANILYDKALSQIDTEYSRSRRVQ